MQKIFLSGNTTATNYSFLKRNLFNTTAVNTRANSRRSFSLFSVSITTGKLQILNVLLRNFEAEKHRVLIFTQMTKVLDILEVFLNYHGYRYLRLDGSTNIEERMVSDRNHSLHFRQELKSAPMFCRGGWNVSIMTNESSVSFFQLVAEELG